jgi:Domain of unknown function (DUF4082)
MLVVITSVVASSADAQVAPIVDFMGGGAYGAIGSTNPTLNGTLGFSFDVTTATTISGLGFFDVGSNGLINSHQVGLWTSGGTLLATATLDNSSNVFASTSALGDWRETDISLLNLNPGSYVLGAFYLNAFANSEDQAFFYANPSSLSGISYDHAALGLNATLSFPFTNVPLADGGVFGPMAFTDVASATPEPESLGLSLAALAFCGLAFRLRRRPFSSDGSPK